METKSIIITALALFLAGCTPKLNTPTKIDLIEPATGKGFYLVRISSGFRFEIKEEDLPKYQVGQIYVLELNPIKE